MATITTAYGDHDLTNWPETQTRKFEALMTTCANRGLVRKQAEALWNELVKGAGRPTEKECRGENWHMEGSRFVYDHRDPAWNMVETRVNAAL